MSIEDVFLGDEESLVSRFPNFLTAAAVVIVIFILFIFLLSLF